MKKQDNYTKYILDKKAFTIIELIVSMLIISIIIIVGFEALSAVGIGKSKLIDSTNISKETFFFTQKLFEEIKKGGTLDYEEYFNRKVVGNTSFSSGHFEKNTGFGNFGDNGNITTSNYGTGFYYCRSGDGNKMGTGGCATNNFNTYGTSVSGKPQRYGEYSFQFIDYNSNANSDLGDEDGNGNILGDDDDEHLGIGPEVFSGSTDTKELYLISADKKKRTLFRWSLKEDPNKPSSATCTISGGSYTGTGCIGTVEYLKLDGFDRGFDHDISNTNKSGEYDGVIDTWLINPDFAGGTEIVAGSDSTNYWLPLFPDIINVADFQILAYPNKDIKLSWKDTTEGINVAPYVKIKMKLMPSRKTKKKIKGKIPEFELNTTISLTDIYSR